MARESFSRYQSYTVQVENRRKLFRFLKNLLLVFVVYGILQTMLLRSLRVDSPSMLPQIAQGDLVLSTPLLVGPRIPLFNWVLPGPREPQRGDLVEVIPAYHTPEPFWISIPDEILRFFTLNRFSLREKMAPDWDQGTIVRRVIGLPGDKVQVKDYQAYIQPPGETSSLSEWELSQARYDVTKDPLPKYWRPADPQSSQYEQITLGPDEYYVMGDNRSGASDSRHWGVVKKTNLVSLVFLKYWPPSDFGPP